MNKKTTVGNRIRSFRERLEMTVSELSQKCGVNESVINAIEKDEVLPALGVLTKISRSLGQRLGTFMDDQQEFISCCVRAPSYFARYFGTNKTDK